MNRKLASYGIAMLVGLVTMVALAPASSAEHCWEVGVEEDEAQATWGPCSGVTVHVGQSQGEAVEDASDTEATTNSGPCWYVVVPEQEVGPASVAVYHCDPQVSTESPEELLSDAADGASPDVTAEHCWWRWDGQWYCSFTDFVEAVVGWALDGGPLSGSASVGDAVKGADASTTITTEHCWHLGAEVGHAKVDAGPCQDRLSTDEDNPDNVVVYFGYSETEVADGPL